MIYSILAFIVLIGVIVFVHELGHYLAARSTGMRVEKFSVGFPPRFLSFTSMPGVWDFRIFFLNKKIKYLSAIEYAKNQGLKYTISEKTNKKTKKKELEKIVIEYQSKEIILSPHNSFILINGKQYRLSIPIIYNNNDFLLPLDSFQGY